MLSAVQRLVGLPELEQVDVDGTERMALHAAVLARKPMLMDVFRECHELFLRVDEETFGTTSGPRIELGAGVSPVRDTFPEVLATDVVDAPGIDRVLDAQHLDLADASVRALYGQNCFHHFPDPAQFFAEAQRVIAPGGGFLLIEPYHGPVARVLYKRLFASEDFDPEMPGWRNTAAAGPMSDANQALSYIVFERDRAEFQQRFPALELVRTEPLTTYVRYLLSGGLNFRSLVPDRASRRLRQLEGVLAPWAPVLALHQLIVVRRRA